MAGLRIFTSNRLETLARLLAQVIRKPELSPLEKEIVLVQSHGMARWVSMEIARINGICANCLFPFPNTFLSHLLEILLPNAEESEKFDPQTLAFCVMKHLSLRKQRPEYGGVRSYLSQGENQMKLLQLSQKIADVFDSYLIFRPEMILKWENSPSDNKAAHAWQADLWRAIVSQEPSLHRARIRRQLLEKMQNRDEWTRLLPKRVSVFGISYLPNFHLQLIQKLARHSEVNLFLMNPCREYWGDIVNRKEANRIQRSYRKRTSAAEDLHLAHGNRLLSSMGALGRDFFDRISEMEGDWIEAYRPVDGNTLLCTIQNDILNLSDSGHIFRSESDGRSASKMTTMPTVPIDADDSIQVHAAHSPAREVEILHNNLLSMFETSPELLPKDVVVMTPDIEAYAPYIFAVFDTIADERMRIPFSVADRSMMTESILTAGFLALLGIKESRLEVSTVLSLLEYPFIREKFRLSEPDIQLLEEWIRGVDIRWGRDGRSRLAVGMPDYSQNTWEAGLDRLLLGYAMPESERRLFSNILPYDAAEGESGRCLGKFLEFIDALFYWLDRFESSKKLSEWSANLVSLVESMFAVEASNQREYQLLKDHLCRLEKCEALSGLNVKIDFAPIRSYLERYFSRQFFDSGFITGGVTFCAMLPMRSIPFKVICLMGLNGDAFPRASRRLGFDILQRYPQAGDRSRRNDDKYLFLEAVISAREKLYLSFVGQHIQDNSKITPSVLLSELLDTIQERFGIPGEGMIRYHPLQAFSRAYFRKDSPLPSYSIEDFKACESFAEPQKTPVCFSQKLTEPPEDRRSLSLEALIGFFANPAKFLLRRRLGIFLEEKKTLPEEKENFRLTGLDKYQVEQEIVHQQLAGRSSMDLQNALRAEGTLPYGNVGLYEFKTLIPKAEIFRRSLEKLLAPQPLENIEWQAAIGAFTVSGILRNIHDRKMIQYRYIDKNPKDMIRLWIYHLAGCCEARAPRPLESVFVFRNGVLTYSHVQDSKSVLHDLLRLFWQGLQKPLPFFPATAYRYAEQKIQKKKTGEEALRIVKRSWLSDYGRGESKDPYIALCFVINEALNSEFESLADAVFAPMLAHSVFR
jgi:exodeoxyribonuclease V gamma subunit